RPGATTFPYTTLFRSWVHRIRSRSINVDVHEMMKSGINDDPSDIGGMAVIGSNTTKCLRFGSDVDNRVLARIVGLVSRHDALRQDRKSTRLNSSHVSI